MIIELARYQNPTTLEHWRIVRSNDVDGHYRDDAPINRQCFLESISGPTLDRTKGGTSEIWAFACALSIERSELVTPARVQAEMEAYLALGTPPTPAPVSHSKRPIVAPHVPHALYASSLRSSYAFDASPTRVAFDPEMSTQILAKLLEVAKIDVRAASTAFGNSIVLGRGSDTRSVHLARAQTHKGRPLTDGKSTIERNVRDVAAALLELLELPRLNDGITTCSICGTPTHASESDDLDRCASCATSATSESGS